MITLAIAILVHLWSGFISALFLPPVVAWLERGQCRSRSGIQFNRFEAFVVGILPVIGPVIAHCAFVAWVVMLVVRVIRKISP